MQARIEASPLGRLLISVGVTMTVLAVAVLNMPDSQLRTHLMTVVAPYVRATGLDQDWRVFAPPRELSLAVEARIDDADGSTDTVAIPDRLGLGAYADYRWGKFEERVRLDVNDRLWEPYARFLAERARADGRNPVRVTLVRRWADTRPPGPGPARAPWQEFAFYVLPLA